MIIEGEGRGNVDSVICGRLGNGLFNNIIVIRDLERRSLLECF